MSVYREIDPMIEHRIQLAFKGKREHIVKVNIPNIAYPSQHIDIEISHGSADHVTVPDTVKITFNLDIESTDKHVVCEQCRQDTGGKMVIMLLSKDIDTINNFRYL